MEAYYVYSRCEDGRMFLELYQDGRALSWTFEEQLAHRFATADEAIEACKKINDEGTPQWRAPAYTIT